MPPLSHFSTPDRSNPIKTQTDQFHDYDINNTDDSNLTGSRIISPGLNKAKTSSYNAEAAK